MSSLTFAILWLVAFVAVCLVLLMQLCKEHKSSGMHFSGLGAFTTFFRGRRGGD